MHGFYAIMGGLAIQIPDNLPESKKFLRSDRSEMWFLTFHWRFTLIEARIYAWRPTRPVAGKNKVEK